MTSCCDEILNQQMSFADEEMLVLNNLEMISRWINQSVDRKWTPINDTAVVIMNSSFDILTNRLNN